MSTVDVLLAATFSMMSTTSPMRGELPTMKRSVSRFPIRIWRALRASRAVSMLTIASPTSAITALSSNGLRRK
jgi:hypothetical protein